MTALLLSDIPTNINTLEGLFAWAAEAMYYQFPGNKQLTNNEGVRINYPFGQVNQFEADDRTQYRRYEILVPMKADAATTARYIWDHIDEHDKTSPLGFPEQYKDANLNN
ncbi:MAG: hypothetical protein AB4057_13930 [Crocosphaera sp.]